MLPKIHYPPELPIVAQKEVIIKSIQKNPVIIVAGDTGSGKSTQLPKMCLEAGRGARKTIGCTQPRRIAATALAFRVAEELGDLGQRLVGYKIRFQDRTGPDTRIKFMTDGILLAEIQHGGRLSAYDTLIIDEAHERSLNIDFLLGYLKNLLPIRKNLKIIITSATIDTEKFAAHFDMAPVIEVAGRTFPVEIRYQTKTDQSADNDNGDESHIDRAVRAVIELIAREKPGDILVFMPTEKDILETADSLNRSFRKKTVKPVVLPLFGRLQAADQNRIFRPCKERKVVIATNVAETSLTVPGIRYVVDTGLARISTYNVRAGTTGLPVSAVSRASCDQRAGRCGRTAPGICHRLFQEEDYEKRPLYTLPEIKRSNLAEVILRMTALRIGEPATFPFVDPPHPRAIKDGYKLLSELGAIRFQDRRYSLTAHGKIMAKLPLDPRISRIIIEARDRNAVREIAIIAAALTINDPRTRPAEKEEEADAAHAKFATPGSDFFSLLAIWDRFQHTLAKVKSRSGMRKFCKTHYLSYQRMREWNDIHDQINTILKEEENFPVNRQPASYEAVHQAVVSGYLRNIAVKKTKNVYRGTFDKEITVFPGSNMFNKAGQWIVAADLVETSKLFARTVADIKVEWLEAIAGPLCRSHYSEPRWEKKRGQVVADEKVTLFGLVIVPGRKINFARLHPAARKEARTIFIQAALVEGGLQGHYNFLNRNLKLISRLEGLEDRFRQRGLLADDYTLYEFYDKRLPENVFDRFSLNRLLKGKKDDAFLIMQEDDILYQAPDVEKHDQFPTTLACKDFALRLSYRFNPGAPDDGVTVLIPQDLLSLASPPLFEWLVPGLLVEKITFLLKGLPKNIRRGLIPIPQTAQRLHDGLNPYHGSLYRQLEQAVYKEYKVEIKRRQWPADKLPDHLKMRFLLTDAQGRELKASRNFSELTPSAPKRDDHPNLASLKKKWERENLIGWDFAGLPEKIPLQENNIPHGFAFPALVATCRDGKTRVDLRLHTSREESRKFTREGMRVLYQYQFPRQVKDLRHECEAAVKKLSPPHWFLLEGLENRRTLGQDLQRFVLEEIFATRNGTIHDRNQYTATVERLGKEGLHGRGMEVLGAIVLALQERRTTLDHIGRFASMAASNIAREKFREFRDQVSRIMPADFLETFDFRKLRLTPRYFNALRIRTERAHVSQEKDSAKALALTPFLKRLEKWKRPAQLSEECLAVLSEYEQMLEEFKISLFAQEIKTLFPVSAKRLEKKWTELERIC